LVQLVVTWQSSQTFEVAKWLADLPTAGACSLSWQEKHVPTAEAWSNFAAGFQAVKLVWQSSQTFDAVKCVRVLPVALVPLWQEKQPPVTLE
jgi:hypothetical protein